MLHNAEVHCTYRPDELEGSWHKSKDLLENFKWKFTAPKCSKARVKIRFFYGCLLQCNHNNVTASQSSTLHSPCYESFAKILTGTAPSGPVKLQFISKMWCLTGNERLTYRNLKHSAIQYMRQESATAHQIPTTIAHLKITIFKEYTTNVRRKSAKNKCTSHFWFSIAYHTKIGSIWLPQFRNSNSLPLTWLNLQLLHALRKKTGFNQLMLSLPIE